MLFLANDRARGDMLVQITMAEKIHYPYLLAIRTHIRLLQQWNTPIYMTSRYLFHICQKINLNCILERVAILITIILRLVSSRPGGKLYISKSCCKPSNHRDYPTGNYCKHVFVAREYSYHQRTAKCSHMLFSKNIIYAYYHRIQYYSRFLFQRWPLSQGGTGSTAGGVHQYTFPVAFSTVIDVSLTLASAENSIGYFCKIADLTTTGIKALTMKADSTYTQLRTYYIAVGK